MTFCPRFRHLLQGVDAHDVDNVEGHVQELGQFDRAGRGLALHLNPDTEARSMTGGSPGGEDLNPSEVVVDESILNEWNVGERREAYRIRIGFVGHVPFCFSAIVHRPPLGPPVYIMERLSAKMFMFIESNLYE